MSKPGDYASVRKDIAAILPKKDYDDGSIAPVLIRLAWHASGTYSKHDNSGGSDGATMRFGPESTDGANAGLKYARSFLEPIKKKHPWISYADLWTLSGVVAVEAMGGPKVKWNPGRKDLTEEDVKRQQAKAGKSPVPDNGRLPDAAQGVKHIREVFNRMGFNDREIVALLGAHTVGRCHKDRSGYDGPWTLTPTRFSNQFFVQLLNNKWTKRKWDGPEQYSDPSGNLMMLPADLALLSDPEMAKLCKLYASDKKAFFDDFAAAFAKLLELGVKRSRL